MAALTVGLAAGTLLAAEATFPLVDGDRQAAIVNGRLDEEARLAWRYVGEYANFRAVPVRRAGISLQSYVEKSTGRKLAMVLESRYDPATMPFAVYVGATRMAQMLFGDSLKTVDTDAYIVHVTPSFVVLAGNVRYAEFDFLRTYLGIDNYIPTKLFTIVPKHERVLVPVETRIEVPAFLSRCLGALHTDKGIRAAPEIPWRLHPGNGRYDFHHNIHRLITPEEFGKDHPDYFPLIGGKRLIASGGSRPGPCFSNPGVVDAVVRKCREFFGKHPQALSMSVGMTDTGRYCECPACAKTDGPSVKIGRRTSHWSSRYYTFANKVAKAVQESHPGKCIGCLAYWGTDRPPTFVLEPNIIPYICDSSATWGNAAEREADLSLIDAWVTRVRRFGIYEYLYGTKVFVPRLYTRHLAQKLRYVAEKCPGSGFYAEVYSSHGFDGPKAWITEKLLWDPTQDVDVLMTTWCEACFGPAAEPMKRYFDLLEATWSKNSARVKPTGTNWAYRRERQFEMFTPDALPAIWQLLDEAKAKTGEDQVLLERIDYFASVLKISEVLVRRHHAHAEGAALVERKASAQEVLASLIKNDRDWPRTELWRCIEELQRTDLPRIFGGVESSRATAVMEYVVESSAWEAVYRQVKGGTHEHDALNRAARQSLLAIAPEGFRDEPTAKTRMAELLRMADRIAEAHPTERAPVIDGNLDESCWQWDEQETWFVRNSALPFPYRTRVAFACDEENLYVAVRCQNQSAEFYARYLDQHGEKASECGTSGHLQRTMKGTPGVHLLLDSDVRDRGTKRASGYQLMLNVYGGFWESRSAVKEHRTVWDGQVEEWRSEITLDRAKMAVEVQGRPYLRMNLLRYVRNQWHRQVGGWYPCRETRYSRSGTSDERGWLMLRR